MSEREERAPASTAAANGSGRMSEREERAPASTAAASGSGRMSEREERAPASTAAANGSWQIAELEPEGRRPIRRALVSVYDKSGLADLVGVLGGAGVEIVSTGNTAALVESLGFAVTRGEELTGFPQRLDGRGKTLHPVIPPRLLADQTLAAHREQLADLGIAPFDLLVSNLYPFSETVASGAT